MKNFINLLPTECAGLAIQPGHRMLLTHQKVGTDMWVVLLTRMPGDHCKAWKMPLQEYWALEPKHGTRDRYVRENLVPEVVEKKQKFFQMLLF